MLRRRREGRGKTAIPGEQARPVHRPVQDGIQVQVFGDAEACLAQAGEALPQGGYLQVSLVRWFQTVTSVRRAAATPRPAGFGFDGGNYAAISRM